MPSRGSDTGHWTHKQIRRQRDFRARFRRKFSFHAFFFHAAHTAVGTDARGDPAIRFGGLVLGASFPEMTDEELAARSAAGDGGAFRVLVGRHVDRVYGYCARVTGNRADAEDLVQDVFLRVWRNGHRWDGERLPFEAWLMVLARRICIDYMRRKKPGSHAALVDEMFVDPEPGPHERAQERGIVRKVQAALMTLPVSQRSAIVLRYYQGYSNKEAAAILEVTVCALESLLKRGRANLQRILGDLEKWQ